jgi:ABC-type antimicrobial peptide transport system permease subunit
MKFVAIGMVLGLGASFVLTRFLSGQLYGVGRLDPLVFVGVSLLLGVVALVASVIPARRATTVDPLEALRVE